MKKHEKHAKLIKPEIGFFGRTEIAFLGAPCGLIEALVDKIIENLPSSLNAIYVDADHGSNEMEVFRKAILQDKISHKSLEKKSISVFEQKFLLNDQDLVLVNGNHFEAKSQVVVIHPKKEASLKKRIGQLTDIKAIILDEGETEIYDWLEVSPEIPVFNIAETSKISAFISAQITPAALKVLVLTGGKSTRMGTDKANIAYHGKPQYQFLYKTVEKMGLEAFISCRDDQKEAFEGNIISDKFMGLGPYGAILSAFQTDPNAAWLVIACDLPLVQAGDLEFLKSNRNPYKLATACYNPATDFPDPLFTIWEPKAYQTLLNYLALGYSCPRKVLINSEIEIVNLPKPEILTNANTPEERAIVEGKITSAV
jgi:molybdopterin-guanine dinucleotide biosynthesis protein A